VTTANEEAVFVREGLLRVHEELLERWRHQMNLVGPGPVDVHYADARAALQGLGARGLWVDLGTGAGFPGIVLAAMFPEAEVELVDSRQKRCVFLEEVLGRAATTGVRVRCLRLESLEPGAYDGLTARALAEPAVVLEHARTLLKPGGRVVLFLQGDAPVPPHEGFVVAGDRRYQVGGKGRRSVWLDRLA
jgi:16S rRNA (guanine527-N7)-methyltransferase